MKKLSLLTISSFMTVVSFAQSSDIGDRQALDRVSGNLLYLFQYVDVKGSPFLYDNWSNSVVITDDAMFKNIQLKFDVSNNEFLYKRNDSSFKLGPNVKEVRLFSHNGDSAVFKKGFDVSSSISPSKYIQVLAEGKVTFLKYTKKNVEEYTEYGDATKYKRFVDFYEFYASKDGKFQSVKVNKKDLETLLADKWDKVSQYMSANDLSAKNEDGYAAAIRYYNSH